MEEVSQRGDLTAEAILVCCAAKMKRFHTVAPCLCISVWCCGGASTSQCHDTLAATAQTLQEMRLAADLAVFACLLAITQTKNQSPIQDLALTQRWES
jgi:hypothetical protein